LEACSGAKGASSPARLFCHKQIFYDLRGRDIHYAASRGLSINILKLLKFYIPR
jgi:hypothetical protein